ncbi:MAG TPA: pitrilysin family protein [Polyangiaceae bacterium]|jgi:zinc protease|nr:pitrilysin family protein [Polyangiaceae bacterium]
MRTLLPAFATFCLTAHVHAAPAPAAPPANGAPPSNSAAAAPPAATAAPAAKGAPAAKDSPAAANPFDVPFEKYSLPNGLEVILHHDASLPLVAVNVWYHVGPSSEPKGRSGFAHLFEHLMFEGSKHVGHEFDHLLESVGATNVNGTTSWDRTNYFETVPRQNLELALWLESDRMGFLLDALTPDRLEVQRDVVKNERRQRYENSPYGASELAMYESLFAPDHPYHGAVIGSMEDLSRASMEDVKAFFRAFYSPSNATLAIAGDFDPAIARGWIERYFASLASSPRPSTRLSLTPPLTASVRKNVEEPVQLARVALGWLTPPAYSPDDTVLDLVATLLAGGKATTLYQNLVVKQKVASDVAAALDSNRLTSMFEIDETVAAGTPPKNAEDALDKALAAFATKGPTAAELDRAKRQIRLHVLTDLQRLDGDGGESGRAGTLQRMNEYLGDPGKLPAYIERMNAVTAEDIKRVTRQFLTPSNAVIVTTIPRREPIGASGTAP